LSQDANKSRKRLPGIRTLASDTAGD
jgi:hypothetical protein